MRKTILPAILLLLTVSPLPAQTSTGYKVEEHALNAGGHPSNGTVMTSTSYRVSIDAVGDAVLGRGLSSVSFRMDGGFLNAYPPPGEVLDLWFSDHQTLNWDPEKSVGVYNLYRDLMSNLSGLGYGSCSQQDLTDETATDGATPPSGDGYFYLVTAENRLGEEGTKGSDSDGDERPNPSACP